jgi:ABC-type Fe3+/spermidine/putrescine transport system ATPase subunit
VLRDVSLDVGSGEYVVLMGPNGSGKTTLLRAIVGLGPPVQGEVRFGGRSMDGVPTHRRGIGLLQQDPALFPDRTVWENVAYGLEIRREDRESTRTRVDALLDLLHLTSLAGRLATELSGGEQQRAALARSLAPSPRLLLLDEPFASVDPQLRAELRAEFRDVLRRLGVAVIHVTHDREEGLYLGDRVLLLYDGRLIQSGPPVDVFEHPVNRHAAGFLGYNVMRTDEGWVAVHPRDVRLGPPTAGRVHALVVQVGDGGREKIAFLRGPTGERIEARGAGIPADLTPGDPVGLSWTNGRPVEDSPL